MRYYPVFLNLKGKKAVVVGGGKVAERKIRALMNAGASVKVISPHITKSIGRLKRSGLITHAKRHYKKGDLKNAFIVIACTSSKQINSQITSDAKGLINVVDTPSEGNFIVPSAVNRGHLIIAISTAGVSPAVSKAIRKELEGLYGAKFTKYLQFLAGIRQKALEKIKDSKKRRGFLKAFASEEMFKTLRGKGFKAASRKAIQLFKFKLSFPD